LKLKRILDNFISNAIRYGSDVYIKTYYDDANNVAIDIEDNWDGYS